MTIRNADALPASHSSRDLVQLTEAFEAWVEHGTQEKAAAALGVLRTTLASRIFRYRKVTGCKETPTAKRDALRKQRADDAWAAWEEHGSISAAARSVGLTYSGFRSRLEDYWNAHDMRHGIAPKSLHDWEERQDAAAWKAWQDHGTHKAAAVALGVSTDSVSRRCKGHRYTTGMPAHATPHTHTVKGLPRWVRP